MFYIEKKRIERDDYTLATAEIKSDIMLLMMEDAPQLVIQIIYGLYSGLAFDITVAWYLALFTTLLHAGSQVAEIYTLTRRLPKLWEASVQYRRSIGRN